MYTILLCVYTMFLCVRCLLFQFQVYIFLLSLLQEGQAFLEREGHGDSAGGRTHATAQAEGQEAEIKGSPEIETASLKRMSTMAATAKV